MSEQTVQHPNNQIGVLKTDMIHANNHKGPAPKAPLDEKSCNNVGSTIKNCPKTICRRNPLMPTFSEIIIEPPTGYSFVFPGVRSSSEEVFEFTKLWTYRILSLILALPCALLCGLSMACCSFSSVWCFLPLVKMLRIPLVALEQIIRTISNTLLTPFCESCGRCFSNSYRSGSVTPTCQSPIIPTVIHNDRAAQKQEMHQKNGSAVEATNMT
uniref:Caveolin n=1 Tax=Romanomermis culicivorax TaxID=13658 RepID=A0A915JFT6_ROMCU